MAKAGDLGQRFAQAVKDVQALSAWAKLEARRRRRR